MFFIGLDGIRPESFECTNPRTKYKSIFSLAELLDDFLPLSNSISTTCSTWKLRIPYPFSTSYSTYVFLKGIAIFIPAKDITRPQIKGLSKSTNFLSINQAFTFCLLFYFSFSLTKSKICKESSVFRSICASSYFSLKCFVWSKLYLNNLLKLGTILSIFDNTKVSSSIILFK